MAATGKAKFELVAPLSPEALAARCRSEGIRVGRVRAAVAHAIAESDGHFDFDSVLAGARRVAPEISRGTIYLSLRRFCPPDSSAHRGHNRMCEPAPYDRTVEQMSRPEQTLVFAWRLLVAGRRHCPALHKELAAYAGGETHQVLASLSVVLMTLGRASRKPIAVGHPGCAVVTRDERNVLALVAAAQNGDTNLRDAHLLWLVRAECQATVGIVIQSFVQSIDRMGLHLPVPEPEDTRPATRRLALC